MMKLIFTDIDGVLNSAYYTASTGGGITFIEERKVKNLKKIVDETGAAVVVVSRANAMFGKKFDEVRINGIREFGVEPLDSIPISYYTDFNESKAYPIKRWLERNGHSNAQFVVFDDCPSNLNQEFGERFILISGKHGLTPKHVRKAIEILNDKN